MQDWQTGPQRARLPIPLVQRYHPACGHEGSSRPRFSLFEFLPRCKFSTLTTRQPIVEFNLLKFSRFPLRSPEEKHCC